MSMCTKPRSYSPKLPWPLLGRPEAGGGRRPRPAQHPPPPPPAPAPPHREVDRAGAAVDGDVEVALAAFPVRGPELRQVLDVDVHEAEVVLPEAALAPPGPARGGGRPPAQPL